LGRERYGEGAVVEGEVNHAIGQGSAAALAFDIFEVPSMHLGSGGPSESTALCLRYHDVELGINSQRF
jgi:hypothetical protein